MPYPRHTGRWAFFYSTHFICWTDLTWSPDIWSCLHCAIPSQRDNHSATSGRWRKLHLLEEKTPLLSHKCLKIKFWIIQNFLFTKSSVECEIWHFFTYRNYMTLFHKYLLNEHTFHLTDFTFLPSSFSSGLKAET